MDKHLKDISKSFTLPKEEKFIFFSLMLFLLWCICTIIKNYFTFLLCTHFMRNSSSKFGRSPTIPWVLLLIKKVKLRFHPNFHQKSLQHIILFSSSLRMTESFHWPDWLFYSLPLIHVWLEALLSKYVFRLSQK